MQQIADWLAKLGMSEYTQFFAENDIDLSAPERASTLAPEELRRRQLTALTNLAMASAHSAAGASN